MKYNWFFFTLTFFFLCKIQAQTWKLDTIVDVKKVEQVYLDHFNNIYIVSESTLKKLSPKGKYITEYNNPGFGNITYINVFNPLNILVYYSEYNAFVYLDNHLSTNLNTFNPTDYNFYDVQLASTIDQNALWFYNQADDKLHKWSFKEGRETATSLQVNQLINTQGRPTKIWSNIQNTFLIYPESGIAVFDNFGGFVKLIPIKGFQNVFFSDIRITYIKNGVLFKLNDTTKKEEKTLLPFNDFEASHYNGNKLILLKKDQLYIYFKP